MNNKPIVLVMYDPKVNPLRPIHAAQETSGYGEGPESPAVRVVAIPKDPHKHFVHRPFVYIIERVGRDSANGERWEVADGDLRDEVLTRYISDLRAMPPLATLLEEATIAIRAQLAEIARLRGEPEPQDGPVFTIPAALRDIERRFGIDPHGSEPVPGETSKHEPVCTFIAADGRRFRIEIGHLAGHSEEWPMVGKYEIDILDSAGKSVLSEPIRVEHFTAKSLGASSKK